MGTLYILSNWKTLTKEQKHLFIRGVRFGMYFGLFLLTILYSILYNLF